MPAVLIFETMEDLGEPHLLQCQILLQGQMLMQSLIKQGTPKSSLYPRPYLSCSVSPQKQEKQFLDSLVLIC